MWQTCETRGEAKPAVTGRIPGPLFGHTHFIINPASAAGRTAKRWFALLPRIREKWQNRFTYSLTAYPGQAFRIARLAAHSGCQEMVVMGGDGTLQEVINGLLHHGQPINPAGRLALLSSGTGQGLARSLSLPKSLTDQLELIREGHTQSLDVAEITFTGEDGRVHRRCFVNECQIGIGGRVVARLGAHTKKLGGFLAFGFTALSTALGYPPQPITLCLDNTIRIEAPLIGLAIANGAITGGGMRLAPDARWNDGKLNILLIHKQSLWQRLRNFPRIYTGSHVNCRAFGFCSATDIGVRGPAGVPVAADGELLGTLPCRIHILPAALRVVAPKQGGNPS